MIVKDLIVPSKIFTENMCKFRSPITPLNIMLFRATVPVSVVG